MRATARLPIEADNLDNADFAVRGRWWGDGTAAYQATLGLRLGHRYVNELHADVLHDHVVDRPLQRPQVIVVGCLDVEIHARRAVLVHLNPGDQGPVEALEDERIEDVRAGMELSHGAAEIGVDAGFDAAGNLSLRVE